MLADAGTEAFAGEIADMECPDHLQHPTTHVNSDGDIVVDACCDKIAAQLTDRFGADD